VPDEQLTISRDPGDLPAFCQAIIGALFQRDLEKRAEDASID
jgi:hypothetical protein